MAINTEKAITYRLIEVNSPRYLSLKDYQGELWKPVVGLEGKYAVSNLGRVKSLPRQRKCGRSENITCKWGGKILKPFKNPSGYYQLSFGYRGNTKRRDKRLLHRVVAQVFLPNPHNLPFINHKNEDIVDNRVSNLEWCTCAYNNAYGTARKRSQITRQKKGIMKPVGKYSSSGELIETYVSCSQAARENSTCKASVSDSCLHGYLLWGYRYKYL